MTNREILFRGFHPCEDGDTTIYVDGKAVKGRWVEGGYAEIAPPPECFSSDPQESIKTCIVAEQGFADWGMPRRYGMYEVIHSTVGQYTEKDDKDGINIFNGDMVTDGEYVYSVEFYEGAWMLKLTYPTGSSYSALYHVAGQRKIIGSIWDKKA